MEKSRLGPSHSAPYSQACFNCFKAKSKCVAHSSGVGCQRCHRLNKQCSPSDSLRRQATEAKQKENARINELEDRLHSLASQLHSQQASISGNTIQQPNVNIASTDMLDGLSDDVAQKRLDIFRSRMQCHLTFVHLPAHQTAKLLRCDRPLLFRAIITVTSLSVAERISRGRELKRLIFDAAPSIDVLLGLLIYIAWGWEHVLNHCSLSRLMMQAMSMVGEMGLNQPVCSNRNTMAHFSPSPESQDIDKSSMTTQLFFERHRALLACFLLSSIVSNYFGQIDALRWTLQMDEALVAMTVNKECPTDATLALTVRMQLLVERAVQILHQQEGDRANAGSTTAAAVISLKALQEELQELRSSLSPQFKQNDSLIAHTYYVELCVSEIIRMVKAMVPILIHHFRSIAHNGDLARGTIDTSTHAAQKLSYLWQSVHAIRACTSAFLALSPSDLLAISFIQWAELTHCITILNNTTTVEQPGLDWVTVRSLVDLPVLLGNIATRLEQAAKEGDEQKPDDIFICLAKMMRDFRPEAVRLPTEETTWLHSQPTAVVANTEGHGHNDKNQSIM